MFQIFGKKNLRKCLFFSVVAKACIFTEKELRQMYLLKILTADLPRHLAIF